MVGKVGEGARCVRHPVAQGASALVRDLGRGHLEPLEGHGPVRRGKELPVPEKPLGLDGKRRRRERAGQQVPGGHAVLDRHVQIDPGVVAVDGPAERQPLHMVPVQVAEEDRAAEGRRAEQCAERTDAGPGVHEQRGRGRAGGHHCDARGVAAVPDEVRSRGRRRASNAQQHKIHVPKVVQTAPAAPECWTAVVASGCGRAGPGRLPASGTSPTGRALGHIQRWW